MVFDFQVTDDSNSDTDDDSKLPVGPLHSVTDVTNHTTPAATLPTARSNHTMSAAANDNSTGANHNRTPTNNRPGPSQANESYK